MPSGPHEAAKADLRMAAREKARAKMEADSQAWREAVDKRKAAAAAAKAEREKVKAECERVREAWEALRRQAREMVEAAS